MVSPRGADGKVSITGAPGAVPAAARAAHPDSFLEYKWLRVMSVDWGDQTCVQYGADGSFAAQLEAGPGGTIIIAPVVQGSCQDQWGRGVAAALLRVPEGVDYRSPSLPFVISGFNNAWHWIATGELGGSAPYLQFTLPDGQHQGCIVPRLYIYRLFDQQGEYVSQVNVNASGPPLTPTGLPIETDQGPQGYWALFKPTVPARPLAEQCITTNPRYDLSGWTAGLDPGWYRARIVFYGVLPGGMETEDVGEFQGRDQAPFNSELESNTGIGYLPLARVGNAEAPRIPATLLNETPSWGSAGIRGIVANEDAARFALGSRRAAQGPFIASPRDPLSGRSVQYLLEPFLPTLAYTGFGFMVPQIPLIPLDDSSLGTLSVTLTKPDGTSVPLASNAPLLQSFLSGSTAMSYPVPLSFAGPGRTYGVTTGLGALLVDFDQYGLYKVTLNGSVKTLWGQNLVLRGTYELWAAEPLDLKLGTFEGTPLAVGDEWSPVVVVEPGVPADVTVGIDHYVAGDPAQKQSYSASGKANRFGYFVAGKTWQPQSHGEYIARVTAKYTDPVDGKLWMATRAGASIVATPNTPLIAHGQRNLQLANIAGDKTMRTWFFTRTFDPKCGEAACDAIGNPDARTVGKYPFFRGDVAWTPDMSPIGASITLEDPTGILTTVAPQVASSYNWGSSTYSADAQDMKQLSIHTTAGSGGQQRPDAIDAWAYWYASSIRADGIHVEHAASEVTAFHNHWYGHDSYNCQIGLACYDVWSNSNNLGDRNGDEEGDVKLLFGGAVVKSAQGKQFVPYASMAVITKAALETGPNTFQLLDPKGNRVCPPYQGATGGLATCGPLITIQGLAYDLFVTPTGTRPGSVLETGNTFAFSGQAWPTLDVAVTVTVTSPSGQLRTFTGRASPSGYIDAKGKTFTVTEPGVYTVHVALTQDRPVPSTGQAPNPPIVADGKTVLRTYGYAAPLSAILGSLDSTYRFTVAEARPEMAVATRVTLRRLAGSFARTPSRITAQFSLPGGSESVRYTVAIPGLLIRDQAVTGTPAQVEVVLDAAELYDQGFTNVVLGAESLAITVTGKSNGEWFAKALNLRGVSPLGGAPATVR
jgi:hypothetical protein